MLCLFSLEKLQERYIVLNGFFMYKDNRMMELTMNMKGIYINRSKGSNAQISAICELLSFDVRCFANF